MKGDGKINITEVIMPRPLLLRPKIFMRSQRNREGKFPFKKSYWPHTFIV